MKMTVFSNSEFGKVRGVEINGEGWLVGKDVAEILGYSNSREALADHVDEEDKGFANCDTPGGMQKMTVINESGFCSLVLRSKFPRSKAFIRWVTSEVLSSIHKNDDCIDDQEDVNDVEWLSSAVLVHAEDERFPIDARVLHQKLKVETPYRKWFPRMCEYGFVEGVDFNPDKKVRVQTEGNRDVAREVEHHMLTISMAKELCMLQRSDAGKQVRTYLIQIETAWNSPAQVMARALKMADATISELHLQIEDLTKRAELMQPKAEYYDALCSKDGTTNLRTTAKELDIPEKQFTKMLVDNKILYRDQCGILVPYAKYAHNGWFKVKEKCGDKYITWQTRVTTNGKDALRKILCGGNR